MAEVLEGADDAVVAPGRVFARHSDDVHGDALHDELAVGVLARERPLLGDELPVPAEDRLRRDDRRELVEHAPAEWDAADGEPDAIVIIQAELAPAERRFEDAVLLAEVLEDALLVAAEPAGEEDGEDLDDRGHGARSVAGCCGQGASVGGSWDQRHLCGG